MLLLLLQEEAAFGHKNLAEKVEERLRSLRGSQDRQAAQMGGVKEEVHSALKEQREKTLALELRVQGEVQPTNSTHELHSPPPCALTSPNPEPVKPQSMVENARAGRGCVSRRMRRFLSVNVS